MTRTLALALLAGFCAPDRAAAQTYIWPGNQVGGSGGTGVSGNWGEARWRLSNAQGTNVPAPGAANSVSALNGSTDFTLDVTDARFITNVAYNNASATLHIRGGGSLSASGTFNQTNGNLIIDGGLSVTGAFTLGGGSLSGAGSLSFGSTFNWGGGTLAGAIVSASGGTFNGGTKALGNGGNLTLSGGTTTFTGTIGYFGTGSVTIGNGATLAIQNDIDVYRDSSYAGAAPFTIQAGGTLRKTAGGGTAEFQPNLTITNAGTIWNSSNILEFSSSITNTGAIISDATTTTRFTGGTLTLNGGSAFTGGGTVQLLGGTNATAVIDVQSSTTFASPGTLRLEVGTVRGNSSTLTINGTLSWKESLIDGAVTVRATNGGLIDGTARIGTGTMQLSAGTFSWTNGDIQFDGGGKLQIDAGATLTHAGNRGFVRTADSPVLQIDGTLEKASGTGSLTIPAGLTATNTGLVRVLTSRVDMAGLFNNTGTIHTASGAAFHVVGSGVLNLNGGSNVTGTGGLLRLDGTSAVINLGTAVSSDGGLTYFNGTVNGPGTLNLAGPFTWGVFSGGFAGGTINAAGGGNWTNTGTRQIDGGIANLTGGTFTMLDTNVSFTAGSLTVGSSATLNLTGNGSILRPSGTGALTVNGTFSKTGGTGTSTVAAGIATTIGATGVVDVSSGNLRFQTSVTNNGLMRASAGGTLFFDQPVNVTGTGTVNVAGGTLRANLTGTVSVASTNTFTNAGTVEVQAGTLSIGNGTGNLTNFGSGTLTGGTWRAVGGAINLNGRQITTLAAGTTVEISGGSGSITGLNTLTQNNGMLRVFGGASLATGTLTNAGVVEATGTLTSAITTGANGTLTGRGTVNGTVTMNAGGTLTPGPGPFAVPGTGRLTTGTANLNGGSTYQWEISSWTGTDAGTDFDQIAGTSGAKLNLAGATTANRVTLQITTLSGPFPGPLSNFDGSLTRTWVIADYSLGNASGGILNFSADKFTIDTAGFENEVNTTGFALSLGTNANTIILTYTPIPEPSTVVLVAAVAGYSGGLARRVLRRHKGTAGKPAAM